MSRKQLLYGLVVVAAIALAVASYFVYSGGSGDSALPDSDGGGLAITLKPTDHTLGDPKSPIQFVEYAAPDLPALRALERRSLPPVQEGLTSIPARSITCSASFP